MEVDDFGNGNGSMIDDINDFIAIAGEVTDGLCYHALLQVVHIVALEDPALFRYALGRAGIGCDLSA